MTQPSTTTISALIVGYVYGDATPDENRQLDEWASLSAENRSQLELFSDGDWFEEQSVNDIEIDLDERSNTFWAIMTAEPTPTVQATQQNHEPVKGKKPKTGLQQVWIIGKLSGIIRKYFIR